MAKPRRNAAKKAVTPTPDPTKVEKRGGARMPGKGKRLGRPRKPKTEKRKNVSITMLPSTWEIVDELVDQADSKGTNRGTVIEDIVIKHKQKSERVKKVAKVRKETQSTNAALVH